MGKSKEAEVQGEDLGIDAETAEMLEGDVKKGKARKFILIYKGAQIKKLIVFKKGPFQTRIQKARKDGFKGDAVCGIVTGSGVSLKFQLAGNKEVADAMSVDGAIEDEPTKTTKLKEFLAENNLARKPEYQIIRDVSGFAKPEADGDGAPTPAAGGGAASSAAPPAGPKTNGAANADLAAKVKKIKSAVVPRIKEAVEADPSSKDKIVSLLESASEHEKQQSFGDAFEYFKSLAETVTKALGGSTPKEKYEAALPGAELKVKTLKDHPQAAAIKAELDKIENSLKQAKSLAQGGKYAEANNELATLDKSYPAAKEIADKTEQKRRSESNIREVFNNFKEHQGIGVIDPAKVKEIADRFPELDVAIKGRKWDDFDSVASDMRGKMNTYKQLANRHGDYVGLRSNALLLIQALQAHPNKDAIQPEIAAIQKDLIDEAKKEYETNKSYPKARALLVKVEAKYNAAKSKADTKGQDGFKKECDAAKLKLKSLDKPEKVAVVPEEIAAIKAKLAKAEKYAAAQQYTEALALVAELTSDCDAAEKLVTQRAALDGAEKAASDATGNIEKDRDAAVAAVQKLHDQLQAHPYEPVIRFELGEIQKKIDQAKAT